MKHATVATIALVRHGPSAAGLPPGLVRRDELLAWRASYEAAGLAEDAAPPASVLRLAAGARIVSSDLPRARESAALLAGEEGVVESSPLLREVDLAVPAWLPARLPALGWAALVHAEWLWALLHGRDARPEHLAQARRAAAWLAGLAAPERPVVALTHGVVRRLVARELERAGWTPESGVRRYAHWSVWVLTRA